MSTPIGTGGNPIFPPGYGSTGQADEGLTTESQGGGPLARLRPNRPQPASVRNFTDLKALRAKALYTEDHGQQYRKSHDNPEIIALYRDYLGKPGSEKAHHLLHTSYQKRDIQY